MVWLSPRHARCLAAAGALTLIAAACASRPSTKLSALPSELSPKGRVPAPAWIDNPPKGGAYRYFVGESRDTTDKEKALEKAWVSAFVHVGMTEFPELSSFSSESVENLKRSSFVRKFFVRLERVNWAGIREATELGSPYLDLDPQTGRYTVYRILKWNEAQIIAAHKELRENKQHRIPDAPEAVRREEMRLVEAVQAIQKLNDRIDRRNTILAKVLATAKCGVTIADLMVILGPPDRSNPNNAQLIEKEYYWGNYKVERIGSNPQVALITADNGMGRRRLVCREDAAQHSD